MNIVASVSGELEARFGSDPETMFRQNLAAVRERIAAACRRAGRDPDSVRLLPISKTVPAQMLRHAFAAGIDRFGENKIQEAQGKQEALADLPVAWSIVGHLQSNKVRNLTRFAVEFHALDSLKLAALLDLLPATARIAVQTDAGYVDASRDWPSHRMETVDSLVAAIAANPGITRISVPEDR